VGSQFRVWGLDVLTSNTSIIKLMNNFDFANPNRNREETWNLLDRRYTTAGVGVGIPGLWVETDGSLMRIRGRPPRDPNGRNR